MQVFVFVGNPIIITLCTYMVMRLALKALGLSRGYLLKLWFGLVEMEFFPFLHGRVFENHLSKRNNSQKSSFHRDH
jgi:hypothetical protein